MQKQRDELLKICEVMEIMNVSRSHVYKLIDIGKLQAFKLAKRNGIRVYRSVVENFISGSIISFE